MSLEDLRIVNAILSLLIVGAQAYRLVTDWRAITWRVRAILACQTLVMAVVAYGSWQTWHLDFPPAPYVPMITGSLALLLTALLWPRRRT